MPRYFFHIWDGGLLIQDREGIDLPDAPDVKERLIEAARDVLDEPEWREERTADRSFEIVDENGRIVVVVRFTDLEKEP